MNSLSMKVFFDQPYSSFYPEEISMYQKKYLNYGLLLPRVDKNLADSFLCLFIVPRKKNIFNTEKN